MTSDDWKNIQRRLTKIGFNPGPIDGIRGRKTINAVKRFQESRNLIADGIAGPITYSALIGDAAPGLTPIYDNMPWFDHALQLIGLAEDPRKEVSNPAVIELGDVLDIDYSDDDIPWCGLFVGHCIGSTLSDEPLPPKLLAARSWLKFGEQCEPQVGSVLIFWRIKKSSWQGHIGFYHGEDQSHYYLLGGNQSNKVNVKKIKRKRLLGARWPVTAAAATGEKKAGSADVALTTGEQ